MVVEVEDAQTLWERLIARVEAGEEIDISRDGTVVARLVPVRPGARLLAAEGALARRIRVADDFECRDDEIDRILDEDV